MNDLRDIKRRAREELHQAMSLLAIFIASPGDVGTQISVRRHTKFALLGISEVNDGTASRREVLPKLIFQRSELAAKGLVARRKVVISIEEGEAYTLESSDPPDGDFITWYVTPLAVADTAGLHIPDYDNE